MICWKRLTELEPQLLVLYERAQAIRNGGRYFDPLDVWIPQGRDGMKDELKQLVGWSRKDIAELGTCAAYDVAYDKIFYEGLCGEEPEHL